MNDGVDRREFLTGVAAGAVALSVGGEALAQHHPVASGGAPVNFVSTPPAGFVPMNLPGRVVRVHKAGSLRPGGLFPLPDAARAMVHRAVMELSGRPDVASAWRAFVHPQDRVAVKVNGLGLRNMASNKETIEAIVEGVVAAGVPATQITVYDQWDSFLGATRVSARGLPAGVRIMSHNATHLSGETRVATGRTWYALPLLEATAVIGVPLIKDHSLSGYTGAMKNLTHGSIKNPEDFHQHLCAPQIAELFHHDAIRTRARLHVMDAFKALYNGGPRDNPECRVPFESVMASTDPVAIDRVASDIVDQLRVAHHMPTLAQHGKPVRYLDAAAAMGLGVSDRTHIDTRVIEMT